MISYGSKFNRSFGLYLPFRGNFTTVTVYFHKSNTHLGFTSDNLVNRMCRDGEVHTQIFKDLNQSSFSNTFLDIRNVKSGGLDIRNQFCNILNSYKDRIFYITNETIKLHKIPNPDKPDKPFESVLYLYVFSFSDYSEDFLYVLAERHHIDTCINKKLVRTSAFQIATTECQENLNDMVHSSDTELNSKRYTKDQDSTLSDVFQTRELK